MKHCHFSILYNEIDFLRIKLPFLYKHFDQLIFYDLSAFNEIYNFSSDGSHEYIKNYPDPENKITLIERTDLINIVPLGLSNVVKQKMFSLGSTYIRDDMDVFWCTDMDEFFKVELIKEVENIFSQRVYKSIQLNHYYFWKTLDFILTDDKNLSWDYKEIAVRICLHKPGNKYGHCDIGRQYKPIYKLNDFYFYHFAWIGEKRVRDKFTYYLNNEKTGHIKEEYAYNVWNTFTKELYEKNKDENGYYGEKMHPDPTYTSSIIASPINVFKELPYLDENIINKTIKPYNVNLFYNYYNTEDKERQHEIDYCLEKNLSNPYFDHIFIISENMEKLKIHNNCTYIKINDRPTFALYWHLIQEYSKDDDINIILNSDCYIEKADMNLLSTIENDQAWALTRWDIKNKQTKEAKLWKNDFSQDCWIFKKKFKYYPSDLNFKFGVPGCDNRFQYELTKAGYTIINPSKSFRVYHYHLTNIRTYEEKDRIWRPENFVAAPRTFLTINKKINNFKINLFYNYYKQKNGNKPRQEEIDFCLKKNLENPFVDHVFILCKQDEIENWMKAIRNFTYINIEERPTYSFFWNLIQEKTNNEDINIIINSDCFIEKNDIHILCKMDNEDFWALGKWNIINPTTMESELYDYEHSQDCWIFRKKYNISLEKLNFYFGVPGCDNRFAKEAHDAGYNVVNPSKTVKVYHYHLSNIRNYTQENRVADKGYSIPSVALIKDTVTEKYVMDFKDLYLHTHTQFGDHLLCYGLVKELSKQYRTIYLFTKKEPEMHINNVKRLYSTIKNVQILTDDPKEYPDVMEIGWKDFFDKVHKGLPVVFDKYFYEKAKVPFYLKWDNFYLERDIEKEKDIFYNKLKLKDDEPFVFLQEDLTRKYEISRRHINQNIRMIESAKILDISILDLLYTLERASEIHVINSSFIHFIDLSFILYKINKLGLYYHQYTRPLAYEQPALRCKWAYLQFK